MEFQFAEFKPRAYKKITFRFGAGVIVASLAVECIAPLVAPREECGSGMAPSYCIQGVREPWNHHTSEREFEYTHAAPSAYLASGVSSIAANSFTTGYQEMFLVAIDGNDFKITT